MSKITQALEKAARERLKRFQEQPTATGPSIEVPIEAPAKRGETAAVAHAAIDPHIVAATDPTSPITEQYRIFRTNLQSLRMRPGSKTIIITSAVHGEGKSVTSVNLALTLARQENLRVVLVDADLRKGSVHRWLGLTDGPHEGLSAVLRHGGELNGSLVKLKEPPLRVLVAGSPAQQPAELLESSSMKRVLATLKAQFDVIIIDTPPVLSVADPGILSAQADGVLLVVRAGKTQRKTVGQAQALLKQMKANLLGCVLTHVEYYLPGYYRYYRRQPRETTKPAQESQHAAA
jgi:capsular exopolysaccharide synthesis family protein